MIITHISKKEITASQEINKLYQANPQYKANSYLGEEMIILHDNKEIYSILSYIKTLEKSEIFLAQIKSFYEGKGYAYRIMIELFKIAKETNRDISLLCPKGNVRARDFFKGLNFLEFKNHYMTIKYENIVLE